VRSRGRVDSWLKARGTLSGPRVGHRYEGVAMRNTLVALVVSGCILCFFAGCSTSTETAERDTLTANVGVYPPPPPGIEKVRVGVPAFKISDSEHPGGEGPVAALAADQLTTLAFQSQRFDVIERAQLGQLTQEQNLEGVVRSDELAKQAQVRGVQYLLYGAVTNLRVKSEQATKGWGIGTIFNFLGFGGGIFDYKDTSSKIVAECGVDLRLVEPSTGEVKASHFGEFKRIDSISAMGIQILGSGAQAEADLQITDDDKGKILRLALDEALRKMIPQIDDFLLRRAKEKAPLPTAVAPSVAPVAAPAAPSVPAASAVPAAPAVAAKKFCPDCGAKIEDGVKFCGGCGAKISG
jgi:curli biogenesis system outer membrane secretion channel CsgG